MEKRMRTDEARKEPEATPQPKKHLVLRKETVAALRVRTALKAGVLLDGQPQVDGAHQG